MDDTVKRKLLSSKWNDSYIQISKQVHKLETKYSFLILAQNLEVVEKKNQYMNTDDEHG
jgi:hypothetical protein